MAAIDKIKLKNFKFFYGEETLNLDGNNLLLYGENGSGKSSLYWALYTFFQSASKNEHNLKKYFDLSNPENLINKYAGEDDASIMLEFKDETSKEISFLKKETHDGTAIKEMASTSEFINYRLLSKLYDFYNSEDIDLFPFIEKEMLAFTSLRSILGNYSPTPNSKNGDDWWNYLKGGLGKGNHPRHDSKVVKDFIRRLSVFCKDLEFYLTSLIEDTNKLLKDNFKFNVILYLEFKNASYNNTIDERSVRDREVTYPKVILKAKLEDTLDESNSIDIDKPHVHLNEAKLSAIGLCLRLAQLKKRYLPDINKVIVLDDLLLSLDMSNRDIVLDIVLKQLNTYQIIFLTHDRNFFDFIKHKITQQDTVSNWSFKEMYSHLCDDDKIDKPLIIKSDLNEEEKAKRYFKLKDYTTCSLYLRKSFEKTFKEKLPKELIKSHDGSFISLNSLWQKFISRAQDLKTPVPQTIRDSFDQSKLLILNPQAHYSKLSQPVYKYELEKAFELLDNIKAIPVPDKTILLSKGMVIEFNHPDVNYSIKFKLTSDYYFESINGEKKFNSPKCKILHWQYEDKDFYHPDKNVTFSADTVRSWSEHTLSAKINELGKSEVLNVDWAMFKKHAKIENSMCSITFE